MRKFVKFEINENAEIGNLRKHSSQTPDPRNGTGEFLGTIKMGDKIVMFTRTVESPNHNLEGFIRANEIVYDFSPNGDVDFYYNPEPSEDLIRLQQVLEHAPVEEELKKGATIRDILAMVYREPGKGVDKIVEMDLKPTTRRVRQGDPEEGTEVIIEEPAQQMYITGLMPEVFENLKQGMMYMNENGESFYTLLCQIQELKEQVNTK